MLTQLETRTLICLYCLVCKLWTIPFIWNDDVMRLKLKSSVKYWNFFTWILLLITIIFQILHFPVMVSEKNLNMLVLHGSSFLGHLVLVISKLNIWTYKIEMVHLINQIFYINTNWGNGSCVIQTKIRIWQSSIFIFHTYRLDVLTIPIFITWTILLLSITKALCPIPIIISVLVLFIKIVCTCVPKWVLSRWRCNK